MWPLPEGVGHDNPPPLPAKEPVAKKGDLAHGRSLCEKRCRTDLPGAWPKKKTPSFLRSDQAASLSDTDLIKTVLKDGGPRLTNLQRNDLLCYLHSLYVPIDEFFPEALAPASPHRLP